ncbi:hypothetical protein C474_09914 [Halogeometricum pallidum JCM 14848]|uniref:Uncharacterized protein n=1 Tax=Halogeometricum pallidum JCM 14848 TaxID=1227487 RepID=M0D8W8_HALPD|nr:hypothetical protein [Halogeometricum pallidum]ELZ31142.1 hypothetical protein C474_09914 [Halogeometricum pallidum JCM 14848]
MSVVGAFAVSLGFVCFYYAAKALELRRAVGRARRRDDPTGEVTGTDDAPTAWLLPPDERAAMPEDSASEVSVERGVGLLVFGLLCLLFGLLSSF